MVANKIIDCHRTKIHFDDYSVLNHSGATWLWDFPGATSVSSNTVRNPVVTYTNPGIYSVTLSITDSNGNTSSKTISNMIEVLPSSCAIENQALNVLEIVSPSQTIVSDDLNYGNTTNLSFSGWVKPNGIQNDWAGIICFGANSKSLIGFSSNNQLQFHLNDQFWWIDTDLYAIADEWNYVAFRLTPTQITIFLNDQKWVYNGSFDSIILNKIILGKDYYEYDRTFNGQMEEFTLWNRALTDDEFYLNRHLIKNTINDSNLIAYYQFNNTQNLGVVYDKKNTNDLFISNNISFPISTAPVGIGSSQLFLINNPGNYNFINAFANLNFLTPIPNGKVVVSKLLVAPHNLPSTNSIASEYWILNNYGNNQTFPGFINVNLQTSSNLTNLNTSNLSVYKRNSNGYLQSEWFQDANANAISTNSIQFPAVGLAQSYQWFIGSNVSLSINPVQSNENYILYPNPYIQGRQLVIKNFNETGKFTLYDINAKLIFSKIIQTNELNFDSNLEKGIYFYKIETDSKIFNGKLVVQ